MNYHLLNALLDFPKNTGERTQVILDYDIFILKRKSYRSLLRPRRKYIIPMLLALLKMTTGQFIR